MLAVMVSVACAHHGLGPPATGGAAASSAAVRARGSSQVHQALFRLRYRGVDGRGGVRLTVRTSGWERYQLSAVDTFGRRHWSLDARQGETVLLDHRERRVCRFEGEVVVRAIALSELPVSMLPRVLFGELPAEAPPDAVSSAGEEMRWMGSDEREWRAVMMPGGQPQRWTLWIEGEPLVWWQRRPKGGLLSHRRGAQVSWSKVADERIAGELSTLEIPADYSPGRCDEPDVS